MSEVRAEASCQSQGGSKCDGKKGKWRVTEVAVGMGNEVLVVLKVVGGREKGGRWRVVEGVQEVAHPEGGHRVQRCPPVHRCPRTGAEVFKLQQ